MESPGRSEWSLEMPGVVVMQREFQRDLMAGRELEGEYIV